MWFGIFSKITNPILIINANINIINLTMHIDVPTDTISPIQMIDFYKIPTWKVCILGF